MHLRRLFTLALFCGFPLSAFAEDAGTRLPQLALTPPPSSAGYAPATPSPMTPSPWSGLTIGSEVFGISGSGKYMKGGVGGAADIGYNHEFSNNVVVGVSGAVGYAPSLFRYSPYSGFDVAAANVKVGYDLGRFMPYVTTGVLLEKPHTNLDAGYTGASDAVNGLFTGNSNLKAAGTVGAGFDYAVTDKLTVGLDVSVSRSPGFYSASPLGTGLAGH